MFKFPTGYYKHDNRYRCKKTEDKHLISQQQWTGWMNIICCSVAGKKATGGLGDKGNMMEKVWVRGGGREGAKDKQGKNSLPQLADRGNPAISQQSESKSRWAMSLHFSFNLFLHLPPFFSFVPHAPHELVSFFPAIPLFWLFSLAVFYISTVFP